MTKHAGFAYSAGDRLLLLKKRDGTWELPSTLTHAGEAPLQAAEHASTSLLGMAPEGTVLWAVTQPLKDGEQTIYAKRVDTPFTPNLSKDHSAYGWFKRDQLPHPLSSGVGNVAQRFSMDLITLCKSMADEQFSSPERFYNVTLFAMRITGTGWAYRGGERGEYTLRKRDIWTSPDVLESCQGLPVVIDHPDSAITDDRYFAEHIVGTIIYPFVRDHEVWGIARIQDKGVAHALMEHNWSTSPGIVTSSLSQSRDLPHGTRVTVEGSPYHLDHLALVPEGVWDKYHPPSGIDTPNQPRAPSARGFFVSNGEHSPMARTHHDATHDTPDARLDKNLGATDLHTRLARLLDEVDDLKKQLLTAPKKDVRCDDLSDGDDGDDASAEGDTKRDKQAARADRHDSTQRFDQDEVSPQKDTDDRAMIERMVAQMRKAGARDDVILSCLRDMGADPARFGFDDAKEAKDHAIRDRLDALNRRNDAHEAEMEKIRRRATPLSDEDHNEISNAEAKADSVTQPLGQQTPRYIPGESVSGYRRRLAGSLQKHSQEWGKTRLSDLDDGVFEIAEKQIYADARAAASRPVASAPNAPLQKISTRSASGHTRTEYRGGFRSAFGAFMA
ncbi:DUF2213 domain-containing protein [Saccharibacter floricola]|uniref:DUF2213 domain-containing protein n=1 Tax=Saccharibacter floricola DSM 15669 TaxID=1123227 RepID=A0ABQ0P4J4_9PROT|nr:DUF2213 domain-containing protein [Saccharibacter floricola]GBQ08856.1 hypothetical protein AA15669_1935 [Saccharibacter floricola DSM 15669]